MIRALSVESVGAVPQLQRGRVWCRKCGFTMTVDSALCLQIGWPKCHGETMTIDSPEEQKRLAARRGEEGE
jgi:hypothetical protein